MNKIEIGKTIKERRKALGITQSTLAALSGIGLNTLVAVERGDGNPSVDTILSIVETLGQQITITLKD